MLAGHGEATVLVLTSLAGLMVVSSGASVVDVERYCSERGAVAYIAFRLCYVIVFATLLLNARSLVRALVFRR